MDFEKLRDAAAVSAKANGASEYELYYMSESDTTVMTYKREISSLSSVESGGICLRVLVDGKMGYASSELITEEEIRNLAERAAENARVTDRECSVGIYGGANDYPNPPSNEYSEIPLEELKSAALELSNLCYGASELTVDGTMSGASSTIATVKIANSHGLLLENNSVMNAAMVQAVVKKGDKSESASSVKALKCDTDKALMANDAVSEAISKLDAGRVESGKYNVVISAKQMKAILSAFSPIFSAKEAELGTSLLRGKEGERVASDIVTITDDPMRDGALRKTFFDAEGVPAKKKTVIESGILKTLLYNRETAARANKETTANASKKGYASPIGISPYAFCIEPGRVALSELFGIADNGIYVTELKGLHAGADAVTGDFSIESAGYIIKDGKLDRAVRSFTIAGNFFELLLGISEIADDLAIDVTGRITAFGSPSVLVKNMSVAG